MAGDGITLEQLRQLLGVQAELREQAESRWQQAQRALVALLEAFAPEEVDRRLKNGQPLDSLRVDELGQLVTQQFHSRLRRLQDLKQSGNGSATQPENSQLAGHLEEKEKLRAENLRLTGEVQTLRGERDILANQLIALRQVSAAQIQKSVQSLEERPSTEPPLIGGAPEPDWMQAWRKAETFERDSAILRLLGETGLARRPQVELRVAEKLGIRKAGGSIQALISRLEDLQLIELLRPWDTTGAKTGGRAPDLLRLSERGRLAFWMLSCANPAENEYDALLSRHVSPEHTLLNLQAADLLREAGFQVDLYPPDIHLADGGLFKPDLLAIEADGKTLYLEVEVEANKNHEQRQAKWRNALQAGGGQIYVFCDNRSCMRSIRSEINFVLGRQAGQCYLTNLADLQAGKRAEDGGIWLDVRMNRPVA